MSNDPEGLYRLSQDEAVSYIEELETEIDLRNADNLNLIDDLNRTEQQVDELRYELGVARAEAGRWQQLYQEAIRVQVQR